MHVMQTNSTQKCAWQKCCALQCYKLHHTKDLSAEILHVVVGTHADPRLCAYVPPPEGSPALFLLPGLLLCLQLFLLLLRHLDLLDLGLQHHILLLLPGLECLEHGDTACMWLYVCTVPLHSRTPWEGRSDLRTRSVSTCHTRKRMHLWWSLCLQLIHDVTRHPNPHWIICHNFYMMSQDIQTLSGWIATTFTWCPKTSKPALNDLLQLTHDVPRHPNLHWMTCYNLYMMSQDTQTFTGWLATTYTSCPKAPKPSLGDLLHETPQAQKQQ